MRKDSLACASGFLALVCFCTGCQQKMAVQPSYRPDETSAFFRDGRAARPVVAGTVARGQLRSDAHLFAGKRTRQGRNWELPAATVGLAGTGALAAVGMAASERNDVTEFPFAVTRRVIEHGRDRFMIYCVVCHDPLGTGRGKIVERGYTPPPSLHVARLREAPVGHFFEVISNGYGSMPSYGQQVPPRDRWAIVAYIRALQLSQRFPRAELTGEMRREWREQTQAGGEVHE